MNSDDPDLATKVAMIAMASAVLAALVGAASGALVAHLNRRFPRRNADPQAVGRAVHLASAFVGTDERDYTGGIVIAKWHRAVAEATRVVLQLPEDQLVGLKVRAGEHLAAILATTFLGVPPSSVDTHGDVDLRFWLPDPPSFPLLPRGEVAFEVKSMPGPFRKFNGSIDVAEARGEAGERSISVLVERADDILADARSLLERARDGLARKTSDEVSRNVFLVIHPFDRFAIETYESLVIGKVLAPLEIDVDTVWVLWVPDHLTVWSTKDRSWTDLIFTAVNPDEAEPTSPEALAVLQEAESEFLAGLGYQAGSPYLFGLSAPPADEASSHPPDPTPTEP